MRDCKDCEWSIFDPVWGEYKCEQHEKTIYNTLNQEDCQLFERRLKADEIKLSKGYDDYEEDDLR